MKFYMQVLIALGLGLKRNWHIFAGLVLGIVVGIWLHNVQLPVLMTILTFIGQVFIRLIQMVVIPLVISAIVIGITSVGDSKQIGKANFSQPVPEETDVRKMLHMIILIKKLDCTGKNKTGNCKGGQPGQ